MARGEVVRQVAVAMARLSTLAGRWPVILDEDLPVVDEITGSRHASFVVLRELIEAGQLERVRRGAYVMRDERGVLNADLLGLIAALTPPPYLITAGGALAAHGLSDQHFRKAVVLVVKPRRGFEWRRDRVSYVQTGRSRIWGADRRRGPIVASRERALLDSMAHRNWGVTLSQGVEALDLALERQGSFGDLLATAAARYRNAAIARRLGFLVAHIAGETVAAPFRSLLGSSKAITLLDPSCAPVGQVDPVWRVRVNVDLKVLLAHRVAG